MLVGGGDDLTALDQSLHGRDVVETGNQTSPPRPADFRAATAPSAMLSLAQRIALTSARSETSAETI